MRDAISRDAVELARYVCVTKNTYLIVTGVASGLPFSTM